MHGNADIVACVNSNYRTLVCRGKLFKMAILRFRKKGNHKNTPYSLSNCSQIWFAYKTNPNQIRNSIELSVWVFLCFSSFILDKNYVDPLKNKMYKSKIEERTKSVSSKMNNNRGSIRFSLCVCQFYVESFFFLSIWSVIYWVFYLEWERKSIETLEIISDFLFQSKYFFSRFKCKLSIRNSTFH